MKKLCSTPIKGFPLLLRPVDRGRYVIFETPSIIIISIRILFVMICPTVLWIDDHIFLFLCGQIIKPSLNQNIRNNKLHSSHQKLGLPEFSYGFLPQLMLLTNHSLSYILKWFSGLAARVI